MRFEWRPLRPGELDFELIWLSVTVASAAVGVVWLALHLPVPQCTFRSLTGFPCVTCGATRGVNALLHGDVLTAWRLNPLVLLGLTAVAVFDIYALTVLVAQTHRLRIVLTARPIRRALVAIGCAVVLLNWIYLLRQ